MHDLITSNSPTVLSPRQIASRLNRSKRNGITPEGREKLRQAALQSQPWHFSTGPRTDAGKARSAANGKFKQIGELSVRQRREAVAEVARTLKSMAEIRRYLT